MTDNLRSRIADLLWRTEEKSWEDQAQTIIDDLGMTVETVLSLDEIPEHLQGQFIDGSVLAAWAEDKPKRSRVVGKWEEQ